VVVGTPSYRQKYDNKDPKLGFVVAAEGDLIGKRMLEPRRRSNRCCPCCWQAPRSRRCRHCFRPCVCADFRDQQAYFTIAFDLILSLYDIPPSNLSVADLRESLCEGDLMRSP